MRYKVQILNKLDQIENNLKTVDFIVKRQGTVAELNQAMAVIKEQLEEAKGLVNLEPDGIKRDHIN